MRGRGVGEGRLISRFHRYLCPRQREQILVHWQLCTVLSRFLSRVMRSCWWWCFCWWGCGVHVVRWISRGRGVWVWDCAWFERGRGSCEGDWRPCGFLSAGGVFCGSSVAGGKIVFMIFSMGLARHPQLLGFWKISVKRFRFVLSA